MTEESKNGKKFLILFCIMQMANLAICVQLFLANIASWDIWADEACTIATIEKNMGDVIRITGTDVHPPLYYLALWVAIHILRLDNVRTIIILSRLMALVPYIIILVFLSFKTIKKKSVVFIWGFALLLMLGQMAEFTVEIRMYSLSVLLSFLLSMKTIELVRDMDSGWVGFVLLSLLSIYNHYYAIFPTLICWGIVASCVVQEYLCGNDANDSRRHLSHFFFSILFALLGYCPWLGVLFTQLKTVKEDYWIPDTNLTMIKSIIESYISVGKYPEMFFLFLYVIAILADIFLFAKGKHRKVVCSSFLFILSPLITLFLAYLIAIFYRPVLIFRYLAPCISMMGVGLVECFYVFLNEIRNSFKNKIAITLLRVLVILISTGSFFFAYQRIINVREKEAVIGQNWDELIAVIDNNLSEDNNQFVFDLSGNMIFRPISVVYQDAKKIPTEPNKSAFGRALFPFEEGTTGGNSFFLFVGEGEDSNYIQSEKMLGTYKTDNGVFDLYLISE